MLLNGYIEWQHTKTAYPNFGHVLMHTQSMTRSFPDDIVAIRQHPLDIERCTPQNVLLEPLCGISGGEYDDILVEKF